MTVCCPKIRYFRQNTLYSSSYVSGLENSIGSGESVSNIMKPGKNIRNEEQVRKHSKSSKRNSRHSQFMKTVNTAKKAAKNLYSNKRKSRSRRESSSASRKYWVWKLCVFFIFLGFFHFLGFFFYQTISSFSHQSILNEIDQYEPITRASITKGVVFEYASHPEISENK